MGLQNARKSGCVEVACGNPAGKLVVPHTVVSSEELTIFLCQRGNNISLLNEKKLNYGPYQ
jgi:hypothetical protein